MPNRGMLGLRLGIVGVVAHRSVWRDLFEQEKGFLEEHIGGLAADIQHIGSTAVPDLAAKPILDIAVAVASEDTIAQCVQVLCDSGYIDRGDQGGEGGHLVVKERAPDLRTHHLHIVTLADPQWGWYLRFRDALREDGALRRRYSELKRGLQKRHPQDRLAYTLAKHEFIRAVLE